MKGTKKLGKYEDRRMTVLCKLVIFLVVTGFSDIFTVMPPNWRSDDKQEKQAKKDFFQASDSVLQIGHILGSYTVLREFHTNSFKVSFRR